MQKLANILAVKVSTKVLVFGFFAIAATLSLAPRSIEQTRAESCTVIEDPTFNPFPVTYGGVAGTGCTDFPVVAVRPSNSTPNDYSGSISPQAGEEFYVRIYVHNGAAQGLNPSHTHMQNVEAHTSISGNSINVTLTAGPSIDGFVPQSKSGSVSINTPSGAILEVVPGSGSVYDYNGSLVSSGLTVGDTIPLGSMPACFEFSKQILFKVKVIGTTPAPTPTYSINAQLGSKISGQCLWTGIVTWNTTNVNNVRVYVKSQNAGFEQLAWAATSGNETVNYIDPNDIITYTLRGDGIPDQTAVINSNGLSCEAPVTPVNGVCGSSNGGTFSSAPNTGLCSTGNASAVNGNGPWNWSCAGLNGGSTAYCSAQVINNPGPTCQTPSSGIITAPSSVNPGQTFSVSCDFGIPNSYIPAPADLVNSNTNCQFTNYSGTAANFNCIAPNSGAITMMCQIKNMGGFAQVCSEAQVSKIVYINSNPNPTNGVCGSANNIPVSTVPSGSNLCANGASPSQGPFFNDSTTNPGWWWICSGQNGGTDASCQAPKTTPSNVCTPLSLIAGNSGLSLGSNGPTVTNNGNLQVNPGQTFYAYVDFGKATSAIWAPNINGSSSCVWDNAWLGNSQSIGRFVCVAPTAPGSYSYQTSLYQNNSDNVCPTNALNIGTLTVKAPSVPTLQCTPLNSTINSGSPVTFTATGGNGSFSWTSSGAANSGSNQNVFTATFNQSGNATVHSGDGQTAVCNVTVNQTQPQPQSFTVSVNNFCVGTSATYLFTGTSNLANLSVNGSSVFTPVNGSSQTTNNGVIGTMLAGNGVSTLFLTGHIWTTSDIGHWVRNFTIGNASQSVSFDVINCNPTVTTLVCSPFNQTVNAGQTASFSASGGSGQYTWTATNGQSGNGSNFNSIFNQTGSATVRSSDGQVATCSVTVKQNPQPNPLVCNPNVTQTVGIGQSVSFSAAGGNGNYQWNASGANQNSGNGTNFSTSYQSAGNYIVNVSDGSNTAVCNVHVNPPQFQQLQCTPPTQTANANQTVYFSATGGNGQFTWTAPNSSAQSGNGGNFNTSYSSSNSGYQTVTVRSGDGQQTTCSVLIITQQPQTLICSPQNQTATAGQTVWFSAFGGSGQYTWTATNGQSGNGSGFNTVFNTTGTQHATVRSSDGQTATCNAFINPQNVQNGSLLISKWVAHSNIGDFSTTITGNSGERVSYKIQVTASNGNINNVQLTDYFNIGSGNANYINGTLKVNGTNQPDSSFNSLNLGNISSGQTKTITFDAYVTGAQNQSQTQIVNTATASSSNAASVSASATVIINGQVLGNNVNLILSKVAINNTKNVDATAVAASKEDFITYTLRVTNTSNAAANNFVITDDLSKVLPYADIVDKGNGTLNGNVISFPAQTIPAGGSVTVSFQVRVKFFLANNLSYTMVNTYGNTIVIKINTPKITGKFIAPKTGADTDALVFGGILMAGYAIYRKRNQLVKLVLN